MPHCRYRPAWPAAPWRNFVQWLGSAAWRAAAESDSSDSPIDRSATQQGVTAFAARAAQFYEWRYQEAEARRVEPALKPLAALFSEHGGRLTDSQLEPVLRRFGSEAAIPFDFIGLREELSDLGVIWSADDEDWEMGIPGFADFLLRRG